MTENNINPTYYKDGNGEFIDLIQNGVDDFGSYCQGNILKYSYRANKKHNTPNTDIGKTIKYCEFWLNHLDSKKASERRSEETGQHEEVAPFDKLHSLLNDQEKELLKDKNIRVIHLNGLRMLEDFIKEQEGRRNGKHEINR